MTDTPTAPVTAAPANHYGWGKACDGWVLAPGPDLLVIEEEMPPGASEIRHHHGRARQFFYVLAGDLTMEMDGTLHKLRPASGIEIAPGLRHRAANEGSAPVRFLVISSPTTRGDRIDEG